MISAKYIDSSKTAYDFKMADGSVGTNNPNSARWKDYEDIRIAAGITPSDFVGPTAMQLWEESMLLSDQTMIPRWLEDHIQDDHGGKTANASLQKKYNDKKALRNNKP